MSLFLDVGPDDLLQIGDAFLAIERKSGKRARLKITGKSEVKLLKGALRAAPAVPATDLADVEIGASSPRLRSKE
jgi:hypothetical protein